MTIDQHEPSDVTVRQDGGGLLVYVPSLVQGARLSSGLLKRLAEDIGDSWRVLRWDHGLTPVSGQPMEDVAHRLAVQIRTWAGDNGIGQPVSRIVLVGHSVGGLLVRHAFLLDAALTGAPRSDPFPWTAKVERIVLLAAPNAGFATRRLKPWLRIPYAIAAGVGRLTAEQLQAGSPYITELRLRWVDAFRAEGHQRLTVVQVLGDRDDVVSRSDSLDVEYMEDATRIDVPAARHGDLVDVNRSPERYEILRHAMFGPLDQDRLAAVPPSGTNVYMLLHGIRAGRYSNWVGQLAASLASGDPQALVHTPSYGYFTAVDFALPMSRSRNLRHFLDWYSRLHVTHEGGQRCFAGHSNGTYLLGRALEAVPAIYFDRAYLAGSVLPREYPWTKVVQRDQIRASVHHDRATRDVPVGLLCSALRGLGMRDVGTAGINGFDDRPSAVFEHDGAYSGGHGVALEPERIGHVAAFLRDGHDGVDPGASPSKAFAFASRLAAVASLPLVVGGTMGATRWALQTNDRSRLVALGAGAAVLWNLGRAI